MKLKCGWNYEVSDECSTMFKNPQNFGLHYIDKNICCK
jgi:hypothetical protein